MYRARFLITLSLALIALALAGFLALVPGYLALRFAAPPAPEANAPHATPVATAASDINRAQILIRTILPVLQGTTSPSSLIEEALALKPAGLAITNINYDGTGGKLTLTGSGGREGINAYRDALSRDAHFSSVSIPVSALVGSSGQFSMSLVLAHSI